MSQIDEERLNKRIAIVNKHVARENAHDLDGLLATFGNGARYDDEPWNDVRTGIDGVRSYYEELLHALPDLDIQIIAQHNSSDSIIVEVVIRGTHLGKWRGLPATGRKLEFPLCGIYTFDANDLLAGERIYYDRGVVLRQLGMFREPVSGTGRILTALTHPLTIASAYLRGLKGKS